MKASPERGQAMTELALLLVLFLGLFMGIMDWSWTMYANQSMTSRASQAARWAAVRPYNDTNVAAVKDIVMYGVTPCSGCTADFGLTTGNVSVTNPVTSYTEQNGTAVNTTAITVTISGYTVNHFTPVLGTSFTGRPITASAVWECANAACTAP